MAGTAGPATADIGAPDPIPTAGPATTPPPAPTGPIPTALAQAASSGKPVVVNSETTQTHQLIAQPDGTLSSVDNSLPVRVRKNDAWVGVDATLQQNTDGTYSSAATPSGVTLSGGGSGPLATLTDPAGRQLSYTFPTALPAPTVSGNTALYANVLPGVDLTASVTDQGGFSEVLEVHDATAAANPALKSLALSVTTQGLTLTRTAQNTLAATGSDGTVSFTAPQPLMWDSTTSPAVNTSSTTSKTADSPLALNAADPTAGSGDDTTSTAAGPGTDATVDPVGVSVGSGTMTLTPDASLLGSSTNYPVFIDPYTSPAPGTSQGFDEVYSSSQCSGSPQYGTLQYKGDGQAAGEGVGYMHYGGACGNGLERSFYNLNLGNIPTNASITTSSLDIRTTYAASWNCSKDQPVTLHTMKAAVGPTTDWNNQPTPDEPKYAPVAGQGVTSGYNLNSTCSNSDAQFDVTQVVTDRVNAGQLDWTVGLFGDETISTTNDNYLRFSAGIQSLTTRFDVPPDTPTQLRTAPGGNSVCGTGTIPWISAIGPNGLTFYGDSKSEIYGEHSAIWVNLYDANTNDGTNNQKLLMSAPGLYTISDGGATGSVTATITPQDGHTYSYAVKAIDNASPQLSSPWVEHCHIAYDSTPPTTPKIVADDPAFPQIGDGIPTGKAGPNATMSVQVSAQDPQPANTCTLGQCAASGVDHFVYNIDNASSTSGGTTPAAVDSSGLATATVRVPVNLWGVHTLYITAVDKAGNPSQAAAAYTFNAPWDPNGTYAPGDLTGDGIPDLLAKNSTGGLTLTPGNADLSQGATPSLDGPYIQPLIVSGPNNSPAGKNYDWTHFLVTHHGEDAGHLVDDLFAYDTTAHMMYFGLNDLTVKPGDTRTGFTGGIFTTPGKPALCDPTTPADRCSAAGYIGSDWSASPVTDMVADGDVYADSSTPLYEQPTSLITAEHNGTTTKLWLYAGTGSAGALAKPVLLGDGNWDTSRYTLLGPGTVGGGGTETGGTPTLWVQDKNTGTIYSYQMPVQANSAPPPLLYPPNDSRFNGTTLTTLDPNIYSGVTTPGDVNSPTTTGTPDGYPDLYAYDNHGRLIEFPGGAPDANGNATIATDASTGRPLAINLGTPAPTPAPAHRWTLPGSLSDAVANGPAMVGNGPWTNGTAWADDPERGMTLALDGSSQYTASAAKDSSGTAYPPVVNTANTYTISAWVKLSSLPTHDAVIAAQCGNAACPFKLEYNFTQNAAPEWAVVATGSDDSTATPYIASMGGAAAGVWTHLMAVHDSAVNTITLYVNGSPSGTVNTPAGWTTTGPFTLGAAAPAGAAVNYLPGQISDVQVFTTALTATDAANLAQAPSAGGGYTFAATADWNGDGKTDLIAEDSSPQGATGKLYWFPGDGNHGPRAATGILLGTGFQNYTFVGVADLNGDGKADLIARDPSGNLLLYPGNAGHTLTSHPTTIGAGWTGWTYAGLGDLDGDGHIDLVARDSGGTLWRYMGNGSGGFSGSYTIGSGWTGWTYAGLGDLDGDGHIDLVARDSGGTLWRYMGNGSGGFTGSSQIGTGWTGWTFAGLADWNHDGNTDLIARNGSNVLWYYPGKGTGSFNPRIELGTGW